MPVQTKKQSRGKAKTKEPPEEEPMKVDEPVVNPHQLKLSFLENFLTEAEKIFKDETGIVRKSTQDVTNAIKNLKDSMIRQRLETIVELVQKGELVEAKEKLDANYEMLEFDDLDEILRQSMSGDGEKHLKNAIDFVCKVDTSLQAQAFISIYDEMCSLDRSSDVEILLLLNRVCELDEEERLKEINVKIGQDVNTLIEKLVAEIKKKKEDEYPLTTKASEVCDAKILDSIMPKVVREFFKDPKANAKLLLQYADNCSHNLSTQLHILKATFEHLQLKEKLETDAALHLWATLHYVTKEMKKYFDGMDEELKQFAVDAIEVLQAHQNWYYERISSFIHRIKMCKLVQENASNLMTVMEDYVPWFYAGDVYKSVKLILSAGSTGYFDITGRMLKAIYDAMHQHKHLETYEGYILFMAIDTMSRMEEYTPGISSDIEDLKLKIPKCLVDLRCFEVRKFRIVNKYYNEPLFSPEGDEQVYCWTAGTCDESHLWGISITKGFCQTYFEHSDGATKLGRRVQDKLPTILIRDKKGYDWMMKPAGEECVKIFKTEEGQQPEVEEYLTANPGLCSNDPNKRRVQLTKENSTKRQLWRLEFSPSIGGEKVNVYSMGSEIAETAKDTKK